MNIRRCYLLMVIMLLFILVIGIIGCGEDEEELTLISSNYLPIEVGNWWRYIDPDYPEDQGMIIITGETQLKDGKTVLVVEADKDKGYLSRAANDMILFHEALDDIQGELVYQPLCLVSGGYRPHQARRNRH